MNHSEEMKLMYYHFAVALEKTSELVSLIKHPEHLKFVEAASSQCSCTRTLESFRYVHRFKTVITLSNNPEKMAAKQEIELQEITQVDASSSNDRSEPLEEQR